MRKALVLFSGGQDSTTCLAWALQQFDYVETLAFDYGQRHAVELRCRARIRDKLCQLFPAWQSSLGADHVLPIPVLGQISNTALTREVALNMDANGLPNTFVPGRNILFLTLAAALAYRRGLDILVTGVCETDFSGYPDCRDDSIKALQVALNLGMDSHFRLETPLMWLTKADTWALAQALGGNAFIQLLIEETHTCYLGVRTQIHPWGYGCGECPACSLRREGWIAWNSQRMPPMSA